MSSIYGLLSSNGISVTDDISKKIDDVTAWWKPESRFHYKEGNVLLGQQNLNSHEYSSKESDQIFNHPSGYKIVTDARIDNRKELIQLLKCTPNISNSELILNLYIKYKEASFAKLLGAFAIAIWESKSRKLVCARDQMGVKPLVYYQKDGLFIFGTQKKSISAVNSVDKTLDWSHLFNSMSQLGAELFSTTYLHIKQVPPAHYIVLENNRVTINKYWELDIKKELTYKNDQEYVDQFIHLFEQAIDCRMYKQSITGTHLSGGLDSSGISSVAHRLAKENNWQHKMLSYNVTENYEGEAVRIEENMMAFKLLEYLDASSSFINVNTPKIRSLLTKASHEVLCCDGIARSNNVNTEYEIQAAATELGAKVVLSGFPGDELVTSFCRPFYLEHLSRGNLIGYFFDKRKSRHEMSKRLRAFFPALIAKLNPRANDLMSKQYNKWRYNTDRYAGRSFFINTEYFNSSDELKSALEPKFYPLAHNEFPSSLKQYQRNHVTRSHTHLRMESEQLAGKHWHVEYRYPMTDIRLLQFMISIPMEQKISKDMSRRTFRLGMKNYLPDTIRLRDIKVAGSLKPMSTIQQDPNKKEVYDYIQSTKNQVPFLNYDMIEKWIKSKKSVLGLYHWLILSQLGIEGKIKY